MGNCPAPQPRRTPRPHRLADRPRCRPAALRSRVMRRQRSPRRFRPRHRRLKP
jgi:hypothetical protein